MQTVNLSKIMTPANVSSVCRVHDSAQLNYYFDTHTHARTHAQKIGVNEMTHTQRLRFNVLLLTLCA